MVDSRHDKANLKDPKRGLYGHAHTHARTYARMHPHAAHSVARLLRPTEALGPGEVHSASLKDILHSLLGHFTPFITLLAQ